MRCCLCTLTLVLLLAAAAGTRVRGGVSCLPHSGLLFTMLHFFLHFTQGVNEGLLKPRGVGLVQMRVTGHSVQLSSRCSVSACIMSSPDITHLPRGLGVAMDLVHVLDIDCRLREELL